jgi:NADP-dependent 3-hydroxy acid dehydrogenase YdfG
VSLPGFLGGTAYAEGHDRGRYRGGGSIGFAIAKALASEGYELALIDRKPDTVETITARLRGKGLAAYPYACDVADH